MSKLTRDSFMKITADEKALIHEVTLSDADQTVVLVKEMTTAEQELWRQFIEKASTQKKPLDLTFAELVKRNIFEDDGTGGFRPMFPSNDDLKEIVKIPAGFMKKLVEAIVKVNGLNPPEGAPEQGE